MKAVISSLKSIFCVLLLGAFCQCSSDSENFEQETGNPEKETGNPEQETGNPESESINTFLNNIPDWDNSTETEKPDEVKEPDYTAWEKVNIPWKCQVLSKNLIKSSEKIISVGTNQGKIWPGALVEGNSLETGDLKLIITDRAPITINSDLVINNSSRTIENPNSASVQQAISEIQIEAGNMEEGNQAGAGQMHFEITEASSFSQSMLAMGIHAGFTEPQSQIGMEGSANVSIGREATNHTVVAKFVQEKFTVRLADDLIPTPADFFSEDLTLADFESMQSSGTLGQDNIPLYIESVTYGRILLFTMESTSVATSEELSGALNASFQDYVEGGGEFTDTQRTILNNSTTTIYSAGGTEEGANAAMAKLDWSEFFVPTPVSTAVPLSFTARTLNGKKKVELSTNIDFDQRDNCVAPIAYDITVTLEKVELTRGFCTSCKYTSWLKEDEKWLGDPIAAGLVLGLWNGPELGGAMQIRSEKPDPNLEADPTSFEVASGYCTILGAICPVQDLLNRESKVYTWPYAELVNGNNKLHHKVNGTLRTIDFDYNIRKIALYPDE